jgi:hypothetical protein
VSSSPLRLALLCAVILLVGTLAYLHLEQALDFTLPVIGQRDFEKALRTRTGEPGNLRDMLVLPPDAAGRFTVVGTLCISEKDMNHNGAQRVVFFADTPYVVVLRNGELERYRDVIEYLQRWKSTHADWEIAWWCFPEFAQTCWIVALALSVVAFVTYAVERRGVIMEIVRRTRVGKLEAALPAVPNISVTGLISRLESDLSRESSTATAPPAPRTLSPNNPPPLSADGPVKPAPPDSANHEDHQYKGEYYPVDRHH